MAAGIAGPARAADWTDHVAGVICDRGKRRHPRERVDVCLWHVTDVKLHRPIARFRGKADISRAT